MIVRHSGNIGDILYALPALIAMSKKDLIDLVLVTGVQQTYSEPHPLGSVRLTREWAESLAPLLEVQDYLNSVTVVDQAEFQPRYDGASIVNMDQFRRMDIDPNQGPAQRWFLWTHAEHFDLTESTLETFMDPAYADCWLVGRTSRNQNPLIDYRTLRDLKCAVVGLHEEFDAIRRLVPNIGYVPAKDWLELAQIMAGAKGFIGNQSALFALAESLKVPRLLEVPLRYANVFPVGGKAFEARTPIAWSSALEELTQARRTLDYEPKRQLPSVFLHAQDQSACTLYRATMPAHFLAQLLREKVSIHLGSMIPAENGHKAIMVQRVVKGQFLRAIRKFQSEGKKFIWDTDDLFSALEPTNPAYRDVDEAVKEHLLEVAEAADYITCTTPFLKSQLGHPEKTWVLPNLIDPNIFPAPKREARGFVRILWAGGSSHEGDLAQLEPVYHALKAKYGNKVQWVFMGYHPTWACDYWREPGAGHARLVSKWKDIGFVQSVPLQHYPSALADLSPDIAVCPLSDCLFNRCKSPVKFFEMTLAGAAVVATDLQPYRCIGHGVDGLLVDAGDTYHWVECLSRLIDYPDWRRDYQRTALAKIHRDHSWWSESATAPWREFYRVVAES